MSRGFMPKPHLATWYQNDEDRIRSVSASRVTESTKSITLKAAAPGGEEVEIVLSEAQEVLHLIESLQAAAALLWPKP